MSWALSARACDKDKVEADRLVRPVLHMHRESFFTDNKNKREENGLEGQTRHQAKMGLLEAHYCRRACPFNASRAQKKSVSASHFFHGEVLVEIRCRSDCAVRHQCRYHGEQHTEYDKHAAIHDVGQCYKVHALSRL